MDREINPVTGDYTNQLITHLGNAIYLRLTTPLGSYWADRQLGSLLHTLVREKDVARVGLLAEQYAYEALSPLLNDRRAKEITINHQQQGDGKLLLNIEVIDNRGQKYRFTHHVAVI